MFFRRLVKKGESKNFMAPVQHTPTLSLLKAESPPCITGVGCNRGSQGVEECPILPDL